TYTQVQATSQVFFEVVAEDNGTTITYTLIPNADETTAMLTSNVYSVDQEASLIDFVPQGTTVATFFENVTLSPGATAQIIDKLGLDRNSGQMMLDDKVIVTAPDGTTEHVYYLGMLGYDKDKLAFIMSDVYDVNQVTLTVSVPSGNAPTVGDLVGALQPAPGATINVFSSDGTEKAQGDVIADGDIVKVTAANGVNTANYNVALITGIGQFTNGTVNIYPNPTAGMVHLSGLTAGTVLHVYNSVGSKVLDKVVNQDNEDISLENQRSGLYFIMITDKNKNVLGQYKLILQ
ncbi:MAG TPA: T9SS type A sorting domain-containing protein, partial [Bacteroidales bacterium]|nr:T9SS type A sorting domain-containing protein [Bacteroidales bacterium]